MRTRRSHATSGPARRRDHGAAAVELALLLPILLLIVFGIVDFGRAFNMQITLTQASREGVRGLALGTVTNPTATTQGAAAAPLTGVVVTYTACPASPTPTSMARVTATKSFSYVTPIQPLLSVLGFSALAAPTITGTAEMRCGG